MPRNKLPDTRPSIVHKFSIDEIDFFISIGIYHNGQPGELFITVDRGGTQLSGLLDCFAAMTSLALQNGTTVEELVHKFCFVKFPPMGHVSNPQIKYAHSVIDYIFRWMGYQFCPDFTKQEEADHVEIKSHD